jgi:hypothetical protein
MVSLLYVHLKHNFLGSVREARLKEMSKLLRYEGKYQACWMALKKAAFALHILTVILTKLPPYLRQNFA